MKQFTLVLLFSIAPFFIYSQEFQLQGRVADKQGNALSRAHVHINNNFYLTDENGLYKVRSLKKGEYHLRVSYMGFLQVDSLITLRADTELNFQLLEDTAGLEEVLIEAATGRITPRNSQKVTREYLQDNFAGSLAKSLEKLPGVNAAQIGAGASKPIIRGLGFNRVAVTENGIKQEGQQWGADHGLEIDALSVEEVEIIKGVGSIEHGSDAIAGVIKISNDRIPQDGFSGEILGLYSSVNNSYTASTNLSYKAGKFFYKLKATGSQFGDYLVPTDQIVYLSREIPIYNQAVKNTAGQETDLYAQLGYVGKGFKSTLSLSNIHMKAGFFPGAHGVPSLSRVQDDGDPRNIDYPYQKVNHQKLISKNEWYFDQSALEIILGFQNNHRQEWSRFHTHYTGQQAPRVDPDLELDFDLSTYDVQAKFNTTLSKAHRAAIGIQIQFQGNDISGYNYLLPEYERLSTGLYYTHNYKASENLRLEIGGRLDLSQIETKGYYDTTLYRYLLDNGSSEATAAQYATRSTALERDFSNFNIMAGMLLKLSPHWDFSLNTGTSFRLPTAIELGANGIHHGSFRHEQGDPALEAEKGFVVDTRLDYTKSSIKAALSPYVYYFDNYIFLNPSGEFSILPHAGQIYKFTQSKALLAGFELDFHLHFSENWWAQISLEYLYNRQINQDKARNFPLPFTPPINGFTELGYEFLKKSSTFKETQIFANLTLARKQDRIAQNEKVTPGYEVFGGGLSTRLDINGFKASIDLRANNIFNRKYYNHTSFYRSLEIPEMSRNIQLMVKIPLG